MQRSVNKVLKQQPFSIMMDETTDIGTTKQAAIVVRYYDVDEGKLHTKFFAMEVK